MDKAELDHQYSPSRWSKRFDNPDEVIADHVATVTRASEESKLEVPSKQLRYGQGIKQLMDIFGTDLPNEAPLLIYIHGGYWQALSMEVSSYLVKPLYRSGIKVAVVGYDLAPDVPFREIVQEIEQLWEFVCTANLASEIWVAGHSAGAHLASTLLFNSALEYNTCFKGMVLMSGVYDLTPLMDTYVNDVLKLTREEALMFSSKGKTFKRVNIQILMVLGEFDSEEFHHQSHDFYQDLAKVFRDIEYFMAAGKDHFDLVADLEKEDYVLTQKIIKLITNCEI